MSQAPEQEETFDREDNTTEMTGENLSQDNESASATQAAEETTNNNKANANTENVKSFSDDDLPF